MFVAECRDGEMGREGDRTSPGRSAEMYACIEGRLRSMLQPMTDAQLVILCQACRANERVVPPAVLPFIADQEDAKFIAALMGFSGAHFRVEINNVASDLIGKRRGV